MDGTASYMLATAGCKTGPAGCKCIKSYGVDDPAGDMVVAHVILVSAKVLLVLTLGLWTFDFGLGLDNNCRKCNDITKGRPGCATALVL